MEKVIKQDYPNVLFFVKVFQKEGKVVYECLTEQKSTYDIESELFSKYYERADEEYCSAKSCLDKRLKAVFEIMKQPDFSWENIKESIRILKNDYPCYDAYIEIEYCKKQEELQKYEQLD